MSDVQKAKASSFETIDEAQWRDVATKFLKGKGTIESRLVSTTLDGFQVQPLYIDIPEDSGFPGVAPFTRGSTPVPDKDLPWEVRQEFAHPDVKTSNTQILRDLERGVSGVTLVLDSGFRTGTDAPVTSGIPVRSVADLTHVLDGAYLNMIGIQLDAGLNGHAALALLIAHAESAGTELSEIRGQLGFDPIGQLLRQGQIPASEDRLFDLGTDLAHWCKNNAPNLRPITVSGRIVQESGSSEGQEIGWALSYGVAWMRALTARGLTADEAANSIAFTVTTARDIFLEIGKLRALRKAWARALEAIGVSEPNRAMALNVRGSSASLTERDPWVNMLRVTGQAYAGALGGAQSITTPSFDNALEVPDEFGRRIARNTQLILRDESHLAASEDPAGGSYYLEHLTDQYAKVAWALMQKIEAAGGALAYVTSAALQNAVQETRNKRKALIAKRKMAITGVSEFPNLFEDPIHTPATAAVTPPTGGQTATATQQAVQAGRFDGSVAQAAIQDAKNGAFSSDILRAIVDGSAGLQAPAMRAHRYAEPWEALRDGADAYKAQHGEFPQAFLACVGTIPEHRARATFAQNIFAATGINGPINDGWESIEDTIAAFRASGHKVACICSTDAQYETIVVPLAQGLKDAGARDILVAGKGGENEDAWRKAGVTHFVYTGCNALDTMSAVLTGYGITIKA